MQITIEKRHLELHHVAGKDETRAHMQGVWISLEHREAVATNGTALAMLPIDAMVPIDSEASNKGFLIYTQDCKAMLKLAGKYQDTLVLEVDLSNGSISFQAIDAGYSCKIGLVTYVDYLQVLPTAKTEFSVKLNPTILMDIAKALGKTGARTKNLGLTLEFTGKLNPIRILVDSEVAGCLMPMKS